MVCTWIVTFQALADLTCFITRSEHLDLKLKCMKPVLGSGSSWWWWAKKDAEIFRFESLRQ